MSDNLKKKILVIKNRKHNIFYSYLVSLLVNIISKNETLINGGKIINMLYTYYIVSGVLNIDISKITL